MGGALEKSSSHSNEKLLTAEEHHMLKELFRRISVKEHHHYSVNQQFFLEHVNKTLPPAQSELLWCYIQQSAVRGDVQGTPQLTEHVFLSSLALILHGTPEQRANLLLALSNGTTLVKFTELFTVLLGIYVEVSSATTMLASWKLAESEESLRLVAAHLTSRINPGSDAVDMESLERWLSSEPLAFKVLALVIRKTLGVLQDETTASLVQVPRAESGPWQQGAKSLLDPVSLIFLSSSLKPHLRNEWRLLFHSVLHGESFSTLLKNIRNEGATLIVMSDTAGHVFGAFASHSWQLGSKYIGDSSCFLFQLRPTPRVFLASGYDENFMYLNMHQETLPNGLGLGGQASSPGLWLEQEYGDGRSCPLSPNCLTFNSPCLAASPNFKIASLEVWGLELPKQPDSDDEGVATSILDKDPEAKALLELTGRGPHSEGLRESDATAATPEDHQLHSQHSMNLS